MSDSTSSNAPDLRDTDPLPSETGPSNDGAASDRGPSPEEVEEALVEADLQTETQRLQDELQTLNDRHLRLAAEFTNYRRRVESQMSGTWDRAQADLVRHFLDVLDDLQRVALLDPDDEAVTVQSIVEGIDLVERKFMRTLEEAGATVLSPPAGSTFDPEQMEAMMRVPTDDDALDDTVADVFARGYVFQGHLVRPARVTVHKVD